MRGYLSKYITMKGVNPDDIFMNLSSLEFHWDGDVYIEMAAVHYKGLQ